MGFHIIISNIKSKKNSIKISPKNHEIMKKNLDVLEKKPWLFYVCKLRFL
ncbi:hypothetical protein HNP12_003964 [Aeromonas hydrophila]|nr:hypothetical protein [Aeromonas hydrophila]